MSACKVNQKVFAQMYRGDVKMSVMCAYFGCGKSALRENRKALGLTPRPRGWKPKGYGK